MSSPRKTAIVTGASQGIGAGIVNGFVERGFNVVANYVTQLSIKQMLAQKTGGSIVTITAALARNAIRGVMAAVPMITKGSLETITQHLAMECAKDGIRVNAVAPGVVCTPMHRDTPKDVMDSLSPMGRPATVKDVTAPENYVGYERAENFASPGGAASDKRRAHAVPAQLRLNHWALSGDWTMKKQAAVLNQASGRIAYRFHARDLHLVMGPATRGTSVRFRVRIEGKPPGAAHGIDIDDKGNGTVSEQRLYQLIRQQKPIADRQFEIEFLDSGVEAFAFTFG